MGTESFRVKERPELDVEHSPLSSAVVMKEYSYTSTSPMGRTACTEPEYLYKGDLYLYLFLDRIFLQKRYLRFSERQCFTELHSENLGSDDSTNHLTSYNVTYFTFWCFTLHLTQLCQKE
jgi:hypothetical protein